MPYSTFIPHHINATPNDLAGNNGIGRYVLLPGSDGRAKQIAMQFENTRVLEHPRGHHVYLGTIKADTNKIDVAAISSGMGCPSMEIILHELLQLGAKRFLRVGTAGSLQPKLVTLGDIINVQASVRDEKTSLDYMPVSVPAVASFDMMLAISLAAKNLQMERLHTGSVHCKSSLYAREFCEGPQAEENKAYLDLLSRCGILASEMETATLFIQSQLYNHQLNLTGKGSAHQVKTGAILGIISVPAKDHFEPAQEKTTDAQLIQLALETIRTLFNSEAN
jgi:uridine phosphorylase